MNWDEFFQEHLLTIVIVAVTVALLLIALIIFLIVRSDRRSNKISSYLNDYFLKTDFTYELCPKESDPFYDFIKIGYKCLDYQITYHFYVLKSDNSRAAAKKEVSRLIKNNILCDYTLKIIPKREFEGYAY